MSFFLTYFLAITLLTLVAIGLALFHIYRNGRPPKPLTGSRRTLFALVAQWGFFLLNGYTLLPEEFGSFLFTFIWIVLILLLAIYTVREFNHNRPLSYILFSTTFITFTLSAIMHGIASM